VELPGRVAVESFSNNIDNINPADYRWQRLRPLKNFIVDHLMPGMRQGLGAFSRLPSDRLRLATKLVKSAPVYLEHSADCRQSTLELIKRFPQSGREWVMHAIFEREEVPAEQTTSQPINPVETKPAAAKGKKKGKGRARKEPAEAEEDRKEPVEELGFLEEGLMVPEEGTVSRKRSLSDLLGSDAGEPSAC